MICEKCAFYNYLWFSIFKYICMNEARFKNNKMIIHA